MKNKKPFKIKRTGTCPVCYKKGFSALKSCDVCKGHGQVIFYVEADWVDELVGRKYGSLKKIETLDGETIPFS